jgi:lipopolysaccharide heptosyltransferase II
MHTLPLLNALKEADSNLRVGWLVEASAASLLEGHPSIARLHVSERKKWLKMLKNPLQWGVLCREVRQFLADIRSEDYEVSLDVQGLLKSAIWPWLARIPRRLGYRQAREHADWLYTQKLSAPEIRNPNVSVIERNLDFVRALGIVPGLPTFSLPPLLEDSQQKMETWLGDETRKLVILAPFTRWASKHWVLDYWPVLIRGLVADGLKPVILGAPGDVSQTERILWALEESMREQVLDLTGKTDWPDLYALFARSAVVIGLDSAPLHIANATSVPELIGLYGPTAPGRTGPVGPTAHVLTAGVDCQPCFERDCPLKTHACMVALSPEQVLVEVRRVMVEQKAAS